MRALQHQKKMRRTHNRRGPNPFTKSYESNGPDMKVRGTASHIAEKYVSLARDAQASSDSVMAENYLQHAEHYFRLIAAYQQQNQAANRQPAVDSHDEDEELSDGDRRGNRGGERQSRGRGRGRSERDSNYQANRKIPAEGSLSDQEEEEIKGSQQPSEPRKGRSRLRSPNGRNGGRRPSEDALAADNVDRSTQLEGQDPSQEALPSFLSNQITRIDNEREVDGDDGGEISARPRRGRPRKVASEAEQDSAAS